MYLGQAAGARTVSIHQTPNEANTLESPDCNPYNLGLDTTTMNVASPHAQTLDPPQEQMTLPQSSTPEKFMGVMRNTSHIMANIARNQRYSHSVKSLRPQFPTNVKSQSMSKLKLILNNKTSED